MMAGMTEPVVAGEESIPQAIEFPDGLPGFPHARNFRLLPLDPDLTPFAALRSQDLEGLEFVVVPPGAVFEGYTVEVPDDDATRLELREADDAVVMVIVTVSRPPTANLLGPLVVNRRTGRGRQVVMVGSNYDVRTPLPVG